MVKLKIYSTTTCPYCKAEKDYLTSKNIPFENIFVDEDAVAAQNLIEKSGQMGVPVTEITYEDGKTEYILGFDRPRLEKILGLA